VRDQLKPQSAMMRIPEKVVVTNMVQNISNANTTCDRSQSRDNVIWPRHFFSGFEDSDVVSTADIVGFNNGRRIEHKKAMIAKNK
jgi:hypothetical protein